MSDAESRPPLMDQDVSGGFFTKEQLMLGVPKKLADLEQGSEAWLVLRRQHITGTNFAACLGLSPWDTMASLYREKVEGVTKPSNAAMRRGSALEPVVREHTHTVLAAVQRLQRKGCTPYQIALELTIPEPCQHLAGRIFEPVIFTNTWNDTPLMASLDGFSAAGGRVGLEIKTANKDDHQLAVAGGIPAKYRPQVQSQIAIAGLTGVLYVSYHEASDDTRFVWVAPDEASWEPMFVAASQLWWHVVNKVPPEETVKSRRRVPKFDPLTPIIIDTREQWPLSFGAHPVGRGTLVTGDYALLGYEEVAAVEWKALGDLFHCVGADRARFEDQWERLSRLAHAAVCVEGTQAQLLEGYEYSSVSPFAVLETLHTWSQRFRVPVWFCANRTEASAIVKSYLLHWGKALPVPTAQVQP